MSLKIIGVTAIVGSLGISGGTYINERWALRECRTLVQENKGKEALAVSNAMRTAVFISPPEAKACQDEATIAAANQAIAEGKFPLASRELSKVRDVADGRIKAEAQTLMARLPDLHLAWVQEKIDKGELEVAITELAGMKKLYLKQTEVILRVKALEALARIQKGEQDLRKGPVAAVIPSLSALDREIPFELRARADQLIEAAIEAGAKEQTDLPAVMRWVAMAKKYVSHLGSSVVDKVSDKVLKDRGLAPQINLSDAVTVPPISIAESKSSSNQSKLKIENKTDKVLQIQLIKDSANHRVEIPARGAREIALPPGDYTQTVMSAGSRDQIGVIQLGGNVYSQTFTR